MHFKKSVFPVLLLLSLLLLPGCNSGKNLVRYSKDYVEVGKILDSVPLPYLIRLERGKKQLLAIGISHTYNPEDLQIYVLKEAFIVFNPDVTLNEGGQINEQFEDADEAVSSSGEAGLLKYISDSQNKPLINGDIADSVEFKAMLQKYPADDLLLYYIMERLIIPNLNGAYGDTDINVLYQTAIEKWFIREKFPVEEKLKTFDGYKQLYRSKIGRELELTLNPDIELFDYINPDCKYCEIGRKSKMVRDAALLEKIQSALETNDKVMVVFGHGHILAIEPALRKMMK